MNDIAQFYKLTKTVDELEEIRRTAGKELLKLYDSLVEICPHSEAVDRKSNVRGVGTTRRCMICGVTDYASEGGSPGDEYNYGYAGYPSTSFWKGAKVTEVTDKEFNKYERYHEWVITDGKLRKRFD